MVYDSMLYRRRLHYTGEINQDLKHRGWTASTDAATIELVLRLLELKGEYEVRCYDLH